MSSNSTEIAMEARPTSNPLDVIPDEMPFDVPYGPPISLWIAHRRLLTPPWRRRRSGIGR